MAAYPSIVEMPLAREPTSVTKSAAAPKEPAQEVRLTPQALPKWEWYGNLHFH